MKDRKLLKSGWSPLTSSAIVMCIFKHADIRTIPGSTALQVFKITGCIILKRDVITISQNVSLTNLQL
jgi:hypothetical protein